MANAQLLQPADHITDSPETNKILERLHYENYIKLGGSSIDVHLEDDDYKTAFSAATRTYRSMSSRSVYKTWILIDLEPAVQQYVFDSKVDNVIRIWRSRGLFGGNSGGSGAFESFGAATANTLLRGGIGQNGAAFDLVSYDMVLQYQETLDRLFVREMHFIWRNEINTIFLTQAPDQHEVVSMEVSVIKSFSELLNDHWAFRWLQDYSLAEMKIILGEKYRIFATMVGAQAGTTLKGEALVSEGIQKKTEMETDLLDFVDSSDIPQPIRG